MPAPLTRRQAVQFGSVMMGGWTVGQLLGRTTPIQRGLDPRTDAVLAGGRSPEAVLPIRQCASQSFLSVVALLAAMPFRRWRKRSGMLRKVVTGAAGQPIDRRG
ncbi:hypothetical protein [Sphingomonas paucimobilis]|uniref:hypothetical protein n=1 Tax=Sphingomonas paucimobilis TaxID=13689 RepID=UPI0028D7818B|nr:hypothetical protein [Sphingomonas paucimobilis]